ncbi:MAG TPA: ferrochelatase [Nevskiaceae bacterium]|nr:ferrochelatase [Nevskiaceae bacterium]
MTSPEEDTPPRCGVLLVNLGTPAAPTAAAIRSYLRQFLSDPRVIELPRAAWLPILYGFVLTRRPRRLVPAYRKIWGADGSPLLAISRRQVQAIEARLAQDYGDDIAVELAMAYGEPSADVALQAFEQRHIQRLLVLPLFPQYSGATVGAVHDAVGALLKGRRRLPAVRTVTGYHDDPGYLDALAQCVRRYWAEHGPAGHLLLSFHGLPQRYVDAGDPYQQQCFTTAKLLAQSLGLERDAWSVAFQSRFGKAPWLKPYTDQRLEELAAANGNVDIFCPGFAADCLETLEEVDIRYRALFAARGGASFRVIPCPNDSAAHIQALTRLIIRELGGWLPAAPTSTR